MQRTQAAPDAANPMGTDGFEFVEYTAPDPAALAALFRQLGFRAVARHRSKDVTLYKQGDIHFILDAEPDSFAQAFARVHGPSICAIALRVADAAAALQRAVSLGAERVESRIGPMELNIPAIKGIGGSLIYLVDRYGERTIYDVDFVAQAEPQADEGVGLLAIDHLTHNVHRGRLDEWAQFYERLFGFREIKDFDIEGRFTGLRSRAMGSPCGKIRIPINESADARSQIEEYLAAYRGEGIQHVALASRDIHATVDALRARGLRFLDTPDAYYELLEDRLPGHGEDLAALQRRRILLDGSTRGERRLLLQIFTENVIGPIFFEIIERRGDEGFGEGNFQALFEAVERDQIARGVLRE
jgi:4-hydroxyphenylpyruvate dioxygenase